MIDFVWTRRGLTSGFLELWQTVLTVLIFTVMSPLHSFNTVFKLIVMFLYRCIDRVKEPLCEPNIICFMYLKLHLNLG